MNLLAVSFNCDHCITTGHYLAVKDHVLYIPLIYIIMCLLGTEYTCSESERVSQKDVSEITCGVQKLFAVLLKPILLCGYVIAKFVRLTECLK